MVNGQRLTRRSFLRVAGVAGGATALAACAPAATPQVVEKEVTVEVETETTVAPSEREATVTCIWRNNPNEKRTMEEAFATYKEMRPNVTVEYLVVPSGNEGEQKLLSLFAAGTPPEVFASVFQAGLVDYFYRDMVTDFVPYIERDQYDQSDFFDIALETFTFGSAQVGMPRGGIATCLFLNLDLFDAEGIDYPPADCEDPEWTWDRMVDIARQFTKDTDGDGRIDQYGLVFGNFNYNQYPMLWDKDIFPKDLFKYGITKTHNFRDEIVTQSFQRGVDLIYKDMCSPTREASEALSALGGVFLSGRVAMWAQLAGPTVAKDASFRWGVAAFPRGAADVQQRIMTWTGPLCMGWGCAEPEEGWNLIKFLVSKEGQKIIAPGAFIGTSRKSLHEWWAQQFQTDSQRLLQVERSGYEHGTETPNCRTVAYPEISQILQAGFDPLWLGEKSAEECVETFAEDLDAKLIEVYEKNVDKARAVFPGFLG